MLETKAWMQEFLARLQARFGQRIEFVGLQGSYGREEATERSDIDVVVIFDELTEADILRTGLALKAGGAVELEEMSGRLFAWAKALI